MKVKERQNCQEDLLEEVTFALKSMSKDKERAWLLRGIVMRSVWLLGNKQTNKTKQIKPKKNPKCGRKHPLPELAEIPITHQSGDVEVMCKWGA